MNYTKRQSESNQPQQPVELLQGGWVFRNNESSVERESMMGGEPQIAYTCDEYWIEPQSSIADIEEVTGKLSDQQALFVINNTIGAIIDTVAPLPVPDPIQSIDDLKASKLAEFGIILNRFTVLISRAKLISGDSTDLDVVIETIKGVKDQTVNTLTSFSEIADVQKFSFKEEDIQAMEDMLKPYLF